MHFGAGNKGLDRALEGADTGVRDRALEHLRKRNAVNVVGIRRQTWTAACAHIIGDLRAVFRHKSVFHHDIVRARGSQTNHIPVFFDAVVSAGYQECDMLKAARFVRHD